MGQRNQKRIVFLCTGNYLAGRCAEALFNSVAVKMGLPWVATSRAIAPEDESKQLARMSPAVVNALTTMRLRVTDDLTQAPGLLASDDLETAGRIEIQGDRRDRIVAELEGLGYRVKRAGG